VAMAGDGSAFAVLGLEPDADSAEIEQAYRRLIKQHHPDREGGDASRAAEINRAYRELRATRHLTEPLQINDHWPAGPSPGRGWVFFALLLAIAAGGVLALQGPLAPLTQGLASPSLRGSSRAKPNQAAPDIMDEPLHLAAIDGAAHDALRLSRTRDEMALANASRDCHHLLRSRPSMMQLDRCAAFDDAVVQLQDRDPLRDQGPFSELAVTGRLWSGATSLSDDSLAIDGRLDRVRLRVELALAGIDSVQPR
jgi:curved DNA-binding protein CbpA